MDGHLQLRLQAACHLAQGIRSLQINLTDASTSFQAGLHIACQDRDLHNRLQAAERLAAGEMLLSGAIPRIGPVPRHSDFDQAVTVLEAGMEKQHSDEDLRERLKAAMQLTKGEQLLVKEHYLGAIAAIGDGCSVVHGGTDLSNRLEMLAELAQGEFCMQGERYADAIQCFDEGIDKSPRLSSVKVSDIENRLCTAKYLAAGRKAHAAGELNSAVVSFSTGVGIEHLDGQMTDRLRSALQQVAVQILSQEDRCTTDESVGEADETSQASVLGAMAMALAQGFKLMSERQFDQAASAFDSALDSTDPNMPIEGGDVELRTRLAAACKLAQAEGHLATSSYAKAFEAAFEGCQLQHSDLDIQTRMQATMLLAEGEQSREGQKFRLACEALTRSAELGHSDNDLRRRVHAAICLMEGEALLAEGQFEAAKLCLSRKIDSNHDDEITARLNATAAFANGEVLLAAREFEQSSQLFKTGQAINHRDSNLTNRLATAACLADGEEHLARVRYDAAKARFKAGTGIVHTDGQLHNRVQDALKVAKAEQMVASQQYDGALSVLDVPTTEHKDSNLRMRLQAVRLLAQGGKCLVAREFDEAADAFARGASIDHADSDLHSRLAASQKLAEGERHITNAAFDRAKTSFDLGKAIEHTSTSLVYRISAASLLALAEQERAAMDFVSSLEALSATGDLNYSRHDSTESKAFVDVGLKARIRAVSFLVEGEESLAARDYSSAITSIGSGLAVQHQDAELNNRVQDALKVAKAEQMVASQQYDGALSVLDVPTTEHKDSNLRMRLQAVRLLAQGGKCLVAREFDEAADAFARGASIDHADSDLHSRLAASQKLAKGEGLRVQRRLGQAAEMFQRGLGIEHQDVDLNCRISAVSFLVEGEESLAARDYSSAITSIGSGLAVQHQDTELHNRLQDAVRFARAESLLCTRAYVDARAALEHPAGSDGFEGHVIAHADPDLTARVSAISMLVEAECLRVRKEFDLAFELMQTELSPQLEADHTDEYLSQRLSIAFSFISAERELLGNRCEEAVARADDGLQHAQRDSEVSVCLTALRYLAQGAYKLQCTDLNGAVRCFESGIQLDSDHRDSELTARLRVYSLRAMGEKELAAGEFQSALSTFAQAVDMHGQTPHHDQDLLCRLQAVIKLTEGKAALQQGQNEAVAGVTDYHHAAQQHLHDGTSLTHADTELQQRLHAAWLFVNGEIALRSSDLQAALQSFDGHVGLHGDDELVSRLDSAWHFAHGKLLSSQGLFAEAIQYYVQALNIAHGDGELVRRLRLDLKIAARTHDCQQATGEAPPEGVPNSELTETIANHINAALLFAKGERMLQEPDRLLDSLSAFQEGVALGLSDADLAGRLAAGAKLAEGTDMQQAFNFPRAFLLFDEGLRERHDDDEMKWQLQQGLDQAREMDQHCHALLKSRASVELVAVLGLPAVLDIAEQAQSTQMIDLTGSTFKRLRRSGLTPGYIEAFVSNLAQCLNDGIFMVSATEDAAEPEPQPELTTPPHLQALFTGREVHEAALMKFKLDCRVNGEPVPCVLLGHQIHRSTFVDLLKGFTDNQQLDILSTHMFQSVQVPEGDSEDSGFSEVIAICTQIEPTKTAVALKQATNAMIRGDYDTDGTRTQWLCKYIIGMEEGCSEETRQTATGMLTMLRSNRGPSSSLVAKRPATLHVPSLDLFAGVTLLDLSRVHDHHGLPLTEGGQYELFEENMLGRGSFGDVYKGVYKFPNQKPSPVAFKVFRNSRSNMKDIQFEAQSHSRLGQSHDNIIGFQGVITELDVITELGETDRRIVFVLELAEGGSLRDVLDNRSLYPHLDWQERLRWLLQIAEGMQKMHSLKPHAIVHRDLKTANVLLDRKPSADQTLPTTVKITDFGVAKESAETVRSTMGTYGTEAAAGGGRTGTLAWKAPETFVKAETEKSDVFSFGVTAYEIATRSLPYLGMNEREIERRVRDRFQFSKSRAQRGQICKSQHTEWLEDHPVVDRRPDLTIVEDGCPPGIKDIIQRCWADEPADRPSFTECVAEIRAISGLDQTEKLAAVEQEAQDMRQQAEVASQLAATAVEEARQSREKAAQSEMQMQEMESSPRGVRRTKALPLDSTSAYTLWELAMADADHLSARTLLSSTWLKAGTYRLCPEPKVNVQIIDHPQHSKRYEEYKSQISNPNEQLLFHATGAMASIVEGGFQKKYWTSSAGGWQRFGPGFYFALQASKSHDYPLPEMRALPPGQHRRAMLLCKVAVGREFDTPTNMDTLTGPPPGFHSVHGVATGERDAALRYDELVVYEEAAILPWAVVEYDFVKT